MRTSTFLLGTWALALAIGCGTDASTNPSPYVPGSYVLASINGDGLTGQPCFASVVENAGAAAAETPCAVRLRSFTARFDSIGTLSAIVFTAAVVTQQGDTSTWQLRTPATIQQGAVLVAPWADSTPLSAEQLFLLPNDGTVTDGVLTLRMRVESVLPNASGQEYRRPPQTVFILAAQGVLPPAQLASSYRAFSLGGRSDSACTIWAPPMDRCDVQSLTLRRTGSTWSFAYEAVMLSDGKSYPLASGQQSGLPLVQRGSYVYIGDPWAEPIATPVGYVAPSEFAAVGSVVGNKLVLFPIARPLLPAIPSPLILQPD